MVKNLPALQETWVQSLSQEDTLEKGMATHSRILARRISWTEELGRLHSMGSQRVRHDITNTFTFTGQKWIWVFVVLSCSPRFQWSARFWKMRPQFSSVQFISVAQSCPILCDPMNHSTPGLPVHHQLLRFNQTHVHWVSDAIQPSHPLLSPSPPAPNPSQHQSFFQWVNSSHEAAKVLEFQL